MSASELHSSLLRPAVLQVLKSVGFNQTKPSVVSTLTDLTARYLLLLGEETSKAAISNHDDCIPTIQDVRVALDAVGALRPQIRATEEFLQGSELVDGEEVPFEDLRGVQSFVAWAQGSVNREIRRVAGLARESEANAADLAAVIDEGEDYLTAMKKKHTKTTEDSRYQGTILGKEFEMQPVLIAGGPTTSLDEWHNLQHKQTSLPDQSLSPESSGISSAPSTPLNAATPEAT